MTNRMTKNPIGLAALWMLSMAPLVSGAQTSVSAGVLRVQLGPVSSQAKFVVGPAAGAVEVFGVPGTPDGTRFGGVNAIDWVSGAGDDQLTFEINQAQQFDLAVNTGAGNSQVDVKYVVPPTAVAPIRPTVALHLGAGFKKVQVQLESFGRSVDFGLGGNFGAGDTEFKGELQYKQGSQEAKGLMALNFGAGLNKAEIKVDSEARDLALDLAPRFMQELNTTILSDDPSSSARVRFAPVGVASGSKIGFEMVSAAPSITLDHQVAGGAGADEVKLGLTTLGPATVTSSALVNLGQSMDKIELAYKGLPSTLFNLQGTVDLGGADDEALLLVDGILAGGPAVHCGEGVDKAIGFTLRTACELN